MLHPSRSMGAMRDVLLQGEGGDEDSVFACWEGGPGVYIAVTAHPCHSLSPGLPCFLAGAPPARCRSALPVGTPQASKLKLSGNK